MRSASSALWMIVTITRIQGPNCIRYTCADTGILMPVEGHTSRGNDTMCEEILKGWNHTCSSYARCMKVASDVADEVFVLKKEKKKCGEEVDGANKIGNDCNTSTEHNKLKDCTEHAPEWLVPKIRDAVLCLVAFIAGVVTVCCMQLLARYACRRGRRKRSSAVSFEDRQTVHTSIVDDRVANFINSSDNMSDNGDYLTPEGQSNRRDSPPLYLVSDLATSWLNGTGERSKDEHQQKPSLSGVIMEDALTYESADCLQVDTLGK